MSDEELDPELVDEVRSNAFVPKASLDDILDRHRAGGLTKKAAEDALQHTFIAAYRALRSSDDPIALKAWLYAIARNRCLTVLRARRERPLEEAPEPSTEHLGAEVARRDDLRALLHDLAGLPDDQRAALVLAELGAHNHDEIAEVLDVRREKVKALVFQAREALMRAREARATPCVEIREQLATERGRVPRRSVARRHIDRCPGCADFERDVRGAPKPAGHAMLARRQPGQ